jgi:LmbE family N-acetylglucosaminyl deacetylase
VPVHLVYWTRGEGSGSARRRLFWRCLPPSWHYREGEARRAGAILGAESVTFLGALDPAPRGGVLQAPEGETGTWLKKIDELRALHAPELLVTHGSEGEYGHRAHRRLHEMARELVADSPACSLVTFAAAWPGATPALFLNGNDSAAYVLDAHPFLQKKQEIVLAHRSQDGVLESLVDGPPGSLPCLLEASRFEGYRIWNEGAARAQVLEALGRWAGKNSLEKDGPGRDFHGSPV